MIRTVRPGRIALYTTEKGHKLLAGEVRQRTGADVVINGTLFDYKTWKPLCWVKREGTVLAKSSYQFRGLGWNREDQRFTPAVSGEIDRFENFISCLFLIHEGKPLELRPTPDVARPAARTALFETADARTHIWCSRNKLTPRQLRDTLLGRGDVTWALCLDGGGSTQLSQEGREKITSSRRVQNYLCFWETDREMEPEGGKPMVEINAYSRERDGGKRLAAHFLVREFACRDGADTVLTAPRLVMVLESIRTHFDRPVRIHSGYRTPEYNKTVGGAAHSQHTYGTAADLSVQGVEPAEVARFARQLMPDWGGVGVYDTFTHIDVREVKADWKG